MGKKVKTMDLKGKEYAKVPERIKEFRSDCPNGKIDTEPKFLEDGAVMFKAYIVKDQSDEFSQSATGHALSRKTGEKDFEKLETIAVGRALANLGYLASGDVASSEEMEEFIEYQNRQKEAEVQVAIKAIKATKTIADLQKVWTSIGPIIKEQAVQDAKDAMKEKLSSENKTKKKETK